MMTLLRRLLVWGFYFHRLQQLLLRYEYKKPKLQVNLVDSRIIKVSFLGRLLLKQS